MIVWKCLSIMDRPSVDWGIFGLAVLAIIGELSPSISCPAKQLPEVFGQHLEFIGAENNVSNSQRMNSIFHNDGERKRPRYDWRGQGYGRGLINTRQFNDVNSRWRRRTSGKDR